MLGHDLAEIFADLKPILWDQADLDITDEKLVLEKLNELKPTLVINAAAYTDVDGAENNQNLAQAVNALAIGYLAAACAKIGAILVHYSTEYVFSGQDQAGYPEDAKTSPINVYGQTKALGEELLQQNCEMYYIIRSSWLYGQAPQVGKPRGLNFVQTMLKLAQAGQEIKVVNDQFGKPTYCHDLAIETRKIIDTAKPCGIYHVTNDGVCSWYEFAKKIFEIKDIKVNLKSIESKDYPLPTPRPQYSILINTKLEPMRSWEEALREYLGSRK
jgi:dTDP-4-dehydrorhamnose reductase